MKARIDFSDSEGNAVRINFEEHGDGTMTVTPIVPEGATFDSVDEHTLCGQLFHLTLQALKEASDKAES